MNIYDSKAKRLESTLKPCPFCGNDQVDLWPGKNGHVSPFCCCCGATFAEGGIADGLTDDKGFFYDPKKAVEYWNKRKFVKVP